MIKILGISGSLRRKSFNTNLLRVAAENLPSDATMDIFTLEGIPMYNEDDEVEHGLPERAEALKDAIVAADIIVLSTPEYNNSMPAVLKNAIDWVSRPTADIPRVFGAKPCAVIGAAAGMSGTLLAQDSWLAVFRYLKVAPYFHGRLLVSRAYGITDSEGRITDPAVLEEIRLYFEGMVAFYRK